MKTIVLGPPGTGKTTTLLSKVDSYLKQTDPDKVGYFDEKCETAEDTDFGWRLSKVGKIVWCKYAEIAHNFTESLDDFDSRFKKYGRGSRLISDKYNFEWTPQQFFIFSEDIDLSERRNQRWAEGFNSILET